MKFNYSTLSRVLIALLFVVAGVQKAMHFNQTAAYLEALHIPMASAVTFLVIFIEVVVALVYAWGLRVCYTGGILVGFTVLATALVHRDIGMGDNMIMVLKNIAIIGGILATTGVCSCDRCTVLNPKK
jgi:putative oxidoreductase